MSWTHLRTEKISKARKDYRCDACSAILDGDSIENIKKELDKQELEIFERMERQGFKILKGQPYEKVIGIYDGDFCQARYSIGIYSLAKKFEIFDE